ARARRADIAAARRRRGGRPRAVRRGVSRGRRAARGRRVGGALLGVAERGSARAAPARRRVSGHGQLAHPSRLRGAHGARLRADLLGLGALRARHAAAEPRAGRVDHHAADVLRARLVRRRRAAAAARGRSPRLRSAAADASARPGCVARGGRAPARRDDGLDAGPGARLRAPAASDRRAAPKESAGRAQGDRLHVSRAAATLSQGAVIASACIFGLTYGLTAPLIAQALHHRGVGETLIGLNAALYAIGVLAVARWLPGFAERVGLRTGMALALLLVTLVLPGFVLAALWL